MRYLRLFSIYIKKRLEKTVHPSMRIYMNEIENSFTIKTKTEYYLQLLTSETVKLLRSTER